MIAEPLPRPVSVQDDPSSERLLVERYRYIAQAYAKRWRVRGMEQADIYALALLGLVKAVRAYPPGSPVPFEVFAFRVIRSEVRDAWLRTKRKKRSGPTSGLDDLQELRDPSLTADERISAMPAALHGIEVARFWRSLTSHERNLLRRRMQGEPFTEIGQAMRMTKQAIHKRLRKVRIKALRMGVAARLDGLVDPEQG